MPSEISMPQLSDTMTEGLVVKWRKKEGEAVKSGEEIAEIETDKATMPMEAFDSGTLAWIAAPEGQKVKVGEVLAVLALAGEDAAKVKQEAQAGVRSRPSSVLTQSHGMTPVDVEADHPKLERARATAREETTSGRQPQQAASHREPPRADGDGRVRVSPLARRIAEEKGLDLSQVQGSGPGGRIVERDVRAALDSGTATAPAPAVAQGAPAMPAPPAPAGGTQVIAMNKMRTAIATALQRSKQLVPHFYETIDIDMEAASHLRERLNERLEKEKVRLSINDLVTKAVASALLQHPALNARFNAEKGQITRYGDVNMGLAVAIPDGLIVPVLRGVNRMGLKEIRQRTVDLYERARAQRLRREEQSEATFTITSLGSFGVREFSAIINPPEVGILAVGSAEKRPVVREGQIVARTMMTVTLSADHRVVDGATAAEFLGTLKAMLEEPGMLLV